MLPRKIASRVFKLSEEYHACNGRTIDTTPTCFLEGWTQLALKEESDRLGNDTYKIVHNFSFGPSAPGWKAGVHFTYPRVHVLPSRMVLHSSGHHGTPNAAA